MFLGCSEVWFHAVFIFQWLDLGFGRVAGVTAALVVAGVVELVVIHFRPRWFVAVVQVAFALITLQQLYLAWLFGGLLESGLAVIFGLVVALIALIILGRAAAVFWFVMYVAQVIFSMVIVDRVQPTYEFVNPTSEAGLNMIAVGIITMAAVLYFVRQRDRFQKESDDLLHSILPDEIARRLKVEQTMIADDHDAASVLFADVVDFTPMSADMSPPELVGLLNDVFTTFDGFVAELGLEKIKTVGDEYMVAAGVPQGRPDHAEVMAELALRIRDHTRNHRFDGHAIRLRIGINSGPVVAGIVGTHKFAYDLWGDVVNTASRMESEGIPGAIQVTPATYELIRDEFLCEPRGVVSVKGKGDMRTYLLLSKRETPASR